MCAEAGTGRDGRRWLMKERSSRAAGKRSPPLPRAGLWTPRSPWRRSLFSVTSLNTTGFPGWSRCSCVLSVQHEPALASERPGLVSEAEVQSQSCFPLRALGGTWPASLLVPGGAPRLPGLRDCDPPRLLRRALSLGLPTASSGHACLCVSVSLTSHQPRWVGARPMRGS